jgi:hypothetical protein
MAKEWANKDKYHPSHGVPEPRMPLPKGKDFVCKVPAWGDEKSRRRGGGLERAVKPAWLGSQKPVVLKPVVAGSKLNKVLVDGGGGLNVLFTKTLKKMKLDITHMLTKSTSPFYGIVPGNAAIPLGSVVLPVSFGETRDNYRTEYVKFEVADFETSYHAILGKPAIAKFMAVPHYTYLVLKMPSLAGVLSLQGDLKISFDCDTEAVELASMNQVPNTMMEIYAASKKLAPSELDIPEKSDKANKPQPTEEFLVKTIDLGTGDNSKTTTIGAGLDPK